MKLEQLHKDFMYIPTATSASAMAAQQKRSGKKIMSDVYGKDVKLKRMVAGRYSQQPFFELKPTSSVS